MTFLLLKIYTNHVILQQKNVGIINAAGLGMGLLTNNGPPDWHPAGLEVKEICKQATKYCLVIYQHSILLVIIKLLSKLVKWSSSKTFYNYNSYELFSYHHCLNDPHNT